MIFLSETTSVKCKHACIIYRKIIMIKLKTNEKMDPEEHYPRNSKSHCINSHLIQTTLHYFLCRISALRLVRSDLSLAIFKTRTRLLSWSFF